MKFKNKLLLGFFITISSVGALGAAGCSASLFSSNDQSETTIAAANENSGAKEETTYTIQYYLDEKAEAPSDKVTTVQYGTKTPVLTIAELGFSKDGQKFTGWKVYRESDDTWSLRTIKDKKQKWMKLDNGNLPKGYEFKIHGDGAPSAKATKEGMIKLYGVWEKAE